MTEVARPVGADPAWPDDAIEVGRIVDAWGLKGWIKVQPFASDPQALFSARRWFILPPEKPGVARPATVAGALPTRLKITQVKDHGEVVVALAQILGQLTGQDAMRAAVDKDLTAVQASKQLVDAGSGEGLATTLESPRTTALPGQGSPPGTTEPSMRTSVNASGPCADRMLFCTKRAASPTASGWRVRTTRAAMAAL